MAWSSATYTYAYGIWHNGIPIDQSDLAYLYAFSLDWSSEDKDGDSYYSSDYATNARPSLEGTNQSFVINKDGSITTYFNYNWHLDPDYVAAYGPLTAGVLPWDIREACALLVVEGGNRGDLYDFAGHEGYIEVDLSRKEVTQAIKAKLLDMKRRKHVPLYFRNTQWADVDAALKRYDASIAFIDKYGHAYISNGAYYIHKIDGGTSVELRSARSLPGFVYPFPEDEWVRRFTRDIIRVDSVQGAGKAAKTRDYPLEIKVSRATFPQDAWRGCDAEAIVTVTLVAPDAEYTFPGSYAREGVYKAVIPAATLAKLSPGAYAVIAEARLGKAEGQYATATITLE
jgi:peptide/nickel transport system substrate-binding protein